MSGNNYPPRNGAGLPDRTATRSPGFMGFKPWVVVLALAGIFVPLLFGLPQKDRERWVQESVTSHRDSLLLGEWQSPWIPIQPDAFSSAWIECASIEDALILDKKLDDGWLFSGKLRLAEGGLAWIP